MSVHVDHFQAVNSAEMYQEDFRRIRDMVYDYCGINLHEGKRALVKGRLQKRLRHLNLLSFKEYLDNVDNDGTNREFLLLIDILTTNKTSFFRESQHFNFIRDHIIPTLNGRNVKWWSAGCSSGEEPITMAMTLLEETGNYPATAVKILATDLSIEVIKMAREGVYEPDKLMDVPNYLLSKYFDKITIGKQAFRTKNAIRNKITYGRLNLLEPWPMRGPFQIIMCRNVMIYFDKVTQQKLISRFYNLLEPGGYLFIGHSESVSNKDIGLKSVIPAAYQKL